MHHKHHMHSLCQQYLHQNVMIQTNDNQSYQGMIEGVDDDYVYLVVPMDDMSGGMHYRSEDQRFIGGPGVGFGGVPGGWYGPGYGWYGPGYGYWGYPRPRPGFRRLVLPLAALTAVSLLPFFW